MQVSFEDDAFCLDHEIFVIAMVIMIGPFAVIKSHPCPVRGVPSGFPHFGLERSIMGSTACDATCKMGNYITHLI